jgi:hypothetical protein
VDRRGTATVGGGSPGWIAALAVLVLLCLSRGFEISPIRPGPDPSYFYALNHATAHSLSWGQDFLSTYGPYGFYFTTFDLADLPARRLALALLLAGGAGVTAALVVWREASIPTGLRLVSLGLLLYTFVIQILEYQVVGFLVLLLLFAVREESTKGLVAFGSAGLLAGFCMLVKFSLGFGALLTVAIACLAMGRLRLTLSRAGVALAGALAGLLGGWQLYQGSPGGLSTFLRSGWDMAGGYSAAMSSAPENWPIGVGAFLLWIGLLVAWVVSWRASRPLRSLAVLAMPLFVAWKHSVVRQDVHVKILVLFGLFSMAILLLDAAVLGRWGRALPVVALLTALLITPWYSLPAALLERVRKAPAESCPVNTLESNLSQPLRLCGLRALAEWRDPAAMRTRLEAATRAELRPDVLPASIRTRIGSAAVDVYPWEIAYVPANTLVWANRPLPASFNAYTARLDRLNAAFFESSRRPPYLLWHAPPKGRGPLWSIDERYLLWDEPRTVRTILDRYDLVEASPGILLLQSRARPRFAGLAPVRHEVVDWNTWLDVPATPSVLLAHASIKPRTVARALRTVFRESPVFVSLRFSSGEEARFRIVPESAAAGFWVRPFASTFEELPRLLAQGEGHTVVAIRFQLGRVAQLYEPVAVTWSHLAVADATVVGPTR